MANEPLTNAGFCVLLIFLFLTYSRIIDFKLAALHLPLLTSVAAFVLALLSGRIQSAFSSRIGVCLAAFTVWMILSIPFSVWRGGSVAIFEDMWGKSFLAFVMVTALVRTVRQCRGVMYTIALGVLVTCLMAFYFRTTTEDGRMGLPTGMLTNPNDMAQVILLGMPYWLFMALRRGRVPFLRILAVICMLVMLIVLLKTGSRGGLMTFAALSLVIFLFASMANKLKLAAGLVLLVAICLPLLPQSLRDRYRTVYSDQVTTDLIQAHESTQERYQLLITSLKLTAKHPLFGVGPGQFETAAASYSKQSGAFAHWRETHNVYTQVSSEEGIPGALFYIGALAYCFKELLSVRKMCRMSVALSGGSPWTTIHLPQASEISVMSSCLILSLLAFTLFGFFSSTAYHFFFPTLAGIIAAFGAAARQSLTALRFQTERDRGRVRMPPARIGSRQTVMV